MKLLVLLVFVAGAFGAKIKYDESQTPGPNCTKGFVLNVSTNLCQDIDECTPPRNNSCKASNPCQNTPGSYFCKCATGYTGAMPACFNLNECLHYNKCHGIGAKCKDTKGSYTCECQAGYENLTWSDHDVASCLSIGDQCARNTDNCHANATCRSTPGSFQCYCKDGFRGDGVNCSDADECAEGPRCSFNGVGSSCNNTFGSFACVCDVGYTQSNTNASCLDNDECASNSTHRCNNVTATCLNIPGSYRCQCKKGYVGDGIDCRNETTTWR